MPLFPRRLTLLSSLWVAAWIATWIVVAPATAAAEDSDALSDSFGDLGDSIASLWGKVSGKAQEHGSSALDWFKGVFADADETARDSADIAKTKGAKVTDAAAEKAAEATRAVGNALDRFADKIDD